MATAGAKEPGALKTISELSQELGVAQHILRYWESRFPQLRPMQRAGNRRYYRPADVALAQRINRLLNQEGYTVRGVQKLLRDKEVAESPMLPESPMQADSPMPVALAMSAQPEPRDEPAGVDVFRLIALRNKLEAALD